MVIFRWYPGVHSSCTLLRRFIHSWFNIVIKGVVPMKICHNVSWHKNFQITLYINLYFTGRRRGGMGSHIPNEIMHRANRVSRLDLRHLPTPSQAVSMYHQENGRLSEESRFGDDPLHGDTAKCSIRSQAFRDRHPSFDIIFHELINSNPVPFKNALLFYIDTTFRLSSS
jgi:hypothetical protein